jgi:hypothetical protein
MTEGWAAVESEINRIVAESAQHFDPTTIAHVSDLMAILRGGAAKVRSQEKTFRSITAAETALARLLQSKLRHNQQGNRFDVDAVKSLQPPYLRR